MNIEELDPEVLELIGAVEVVCDEMEFFKDESGVVKFHPTCEKCNKKCKQSFRVSNLKCNRN